MRLCGRSPGRGLGRVLVLLVGVSGLADGLWLQRRCPLAVWNGSLPSALASGGLSRASSPPVPLAGTRHMRLSYVRPCTCRRGSAPGPSLPKVSSARRSALWAASRHRGPLPCPWPFCPPFASLRIPSHPISLYPLWHRPRPGLLDERSRLAPGAAVYPPSPSRCMTG